jgi:FkbM family methyltransferase
MFSYWASKLRTDGPKTILIRRWRRYKKYWVINNYVFGKLVELIGDQVNIGGLRISVDNPQITTREKSKFLFGKYEEPERQAIDSYLRPDLPVVELGGCLGVVSCLINKKLKRPEQHVVIEANPGALPTLEKNRELNNCRFVVRHAALAYDTAKVDLHLTTIQDNTTKTQDNSVQPIRNGHVSVPAVSLEVILKDTKFELVTVVMDIEGAELDLLERELSLLEERVAMLIFEIHIDSLARWDAIVASLIEADFRIVDILDKTWVFANTRFVR